MNIAEKLGLSIEHFCRMTITTKMLFSNVLGHSAELHYEKFLYTQNTSFEKAPTDVHYDYIVNKEKHQVKRFESASTDNNFIGVNLTQTHGDRSGADAFYKRTDFKKLILYDVGFINFLNIDVKDIPHHPDYTERLPGRFRIPRPDNKKLEGFDLDFLNTLKIKNAKFPEAVESLRRKNNWNYQQLLEKSCNLTFDEIDSLFSEENFRLVVGAKGFAAEEHFNIFLEKHNIPYKQIKEMYSKVDHLVKDKTRVQVKIPNERSTSDNYWGVKTHKSHGHGEGELYPADAFDILALFIGFEMNKDYSKYFPKSVSGKFIFIPISDLERHPDYPSHLKRVSQIKKDKYTTNDVSVLE